MGAGKPHFDGAHSKGRKVSPHADANSSILTHRRSVQRPDVGSVLLTQDIDDLLERRGALRSYSGLIPRESVSAINSEQCASGTFGTIQSAAAPEAPAPPDSSIRLERATNSSALPGVTRIVLTIPEPTLIAT